MYDRKGQMLRKGQTVIISQKVVKNCGLKTNQGVVQDSSYNSEQLVNVKVGDDVIDFHAKSLTISSSTTPITTTPIETATVVYEMMMGMKFKTWYQNDFKDHVTGEDDCKDNFAILKDIIEMLSL